MESISRDHNFENRLNLVKKDGNKGKFQIWHEENQNPVIIKITPEGEKPSTKKTGLFLKMLKLIFSADAYNTKPDLGNRGQSKGDKFWKKTYSKTFTQHKK